MTEFLRTKADERLGAAFYDARKERMLTMRQAAFALEISLAEVELLEIAPTRVAVLKVARALEFYQLVDDHELLALLCMSGR
jgi:hypothetical protein